MSAEDEMTRAYGSLMLGRQQGKSEILRIMQERMTNSTQFRGLDANFVIMDEFVDYTDAEPEAEPTEEEKYAGNTNWGQY